MAKRRVTVARCDCGKANKKEYTMFRIAGGTEALAHKYPWTVRIIGRCNGEYF